MTFCKIAPYINSLTYLLTLNAVERLSAAAISGSVTRGGDAACSHIIMSNLVIITYVVLLLLLLSEHETERWRCILR